MRCVTVCFAVVPSMVVYTAAVTGSGHDPGRPVVSVTGNALTDR